MLVTNTTLALLDEQPEATFSKQIYFVHSPV